MVEVLLVPMNVSITCVRRQGTHNALAINADHDNESKNNDQSACLFDDVRSGFA